jgi:hypothetical protein
MAEPALRLLAHAVLAGSRDTAEHLEREVARLVDAWPDAGERRSLGLALLATPAQFGFPWFGGRPIHAGAAGSGIYLLELQAQLIQGDTAGLRAGLGNVDRLRRQLLVVPQQLGVDVVLQESWLKLAIGDTAAATAALDAMLTTLAQQRPTLLQTVQGPAALVLAMGLRARLAARAGDAGTAARWSRAFTELWSGADPALLQEFRDVAQLSR